MHRFAFLMGVLCVCRAEDRSALHVKSSVPGCTGVAWGLSGPQTPKHGSFGLII